MGNSPTKVFISYRREDTGGDAGRLSDTLNQILGSGKVFYDFDQIALGADFEIALKQALNESNVFLALIGPTWEKVLDAEGKPRLADERDFVRLEIVTALAASTVKLVPVLVNRSTLPSSADLPADLNPIRKLQAFEIRRDRWSDDVAALLRRLEIVPMENRRFAGEERPDRQARLISASVEWKRRSEPDSTPRRWVAYVDNHSDAPITIERVLVTTTSLELPIEYDEPVGPGKSSDYELEESQFDPSGERPEIRAQFMDSFGQLWSLRKGILKQMRRRSPQPKTKTAFFA